MVTQKKQNCYFDLSFSQKHYTFAVDMKIVIACDSFKGSCTSEQVAAAITDGIHELLGHSQVDVRRVLIADGGEGTMRTLCQALHGTLVSVPAHDAIMRPIESEYAILPDGTAVMDMAETGGITRLNRNELDPMNATTYGLGEQIVSALARGCTRIYIGLGGSATTDGGRGMIQALNDAGVTDTKANIRVLCDVTNPLYGDNGAAYVFSPQKGANPEQVRLLDERLRAWAAASPHPEAAHIPGAGAAGGLGFALMCFLHAELVSGIETILECQHFDELLTGADLVLTGEGKMDRQTLMNKAPLGVLRHAGRYGVPVVGLAGKVEDKQVLLQAGFSDIVEINPPHTPLQQAMQTEFAMERLRITTKQILRNI